jgi:hypothetical protein
VNVAAVSPTVLPAASYEYVRAGAPVMELSRLLDEEIKYVPETVPVSVSRLPLASYVNPCVRLLPEPLVRRSSESKDLF